MQFILGIHALEIDTEEIPEHALIPLSLILYCFLYFMYGMFSTRGTL